MGKPAAARPPVPNAAPVEAPPVASNPPPLPPAEERKRRGLSAESTARAAETRHTRGQVNRYLRLVAGGNTGDRATKRADRIAEIDQILATGQRMKNVAVYEPGTRTRTGTTEKMSPLHPMERAALMVERRELSEAKPSKRAGFDDLRADVIKRLPAYAQSQGFDAVILLGCGFPQADLIEAGIIAPSPVSVG